jgi:hypothetical protein
MESRYRQWPWLTMAARKNPARLRYPKSPQVQSRKDRRMATSIVSGGVVAALAILCSAASAEPQFGKGPAQAPNKSAAVSSRQEAQTHFDVEIVVKFRNDGAVQGIIDAFWKDPQIAREKFDDFKRNRPDMATATLARVTYSNELVLAYGCAATADRRAAAREIANRLMTLPDIAYAEPDLSFQAEH